MTLGQPRHPKSSCEFKYCLSIEIEKASETVCFKMLHHISKWIKLFYEIKNRYKTLEILKNVFWTVMIVHLIVDNLGVRIGVSPYSSSCANHIQINIRCLHLCYICLVMIGLLLIKRNSNPIKPNLKKKYPTACNCFIRINCNTNWDIPLPHSLQSNVLNLIKAIQPLKSSYVWAVVQKTSV